MPRTSNAWHASHIKKVAIMTQTILDDGALVAIIAQGLTARNLRGQRVLVLIPDATRTMPMPRYFAIVRHALREAGAMQQTWMVALGTHPAMDTDALNRLLGCDLTQLAHDESDVEVVNHAWQDPATLVQVGMIDSDTMSRLSGGLSSDAVPVRVNRAVLTHDHILICGPVFPHEVVGFSGGTNTSSPAFRVLMSSMPPIGWERCSRHMLSLGPPILRSALSSIMQLL